VIILVYIVKWRLIDWMNAYCSCHLPRYNPKILPGAY